MSLSRPSTPATGSTADCRWPSLLPRAKPVGLKISRKAMPLCLLCLTFGPPLYVRGLVAGLADHEASALHRLEIWSLSLSTLSCVQLPARGSMPHAGYPAAPRK
jgi:hypothetical protein